MEEKKKVLLSVKDLVVKFHVRGRVLTAIRNISLDIYENESIAIVGESGSGKSVFTKTFAGMLDSNGFIDHGSITYDDGGNDDTLTKAAVQKSPRLQRRVDALAAKLDEYAKLELGAVTYQELTALEKENKARSELTAEEEAAYAAEMKELKFQRTNLFNDKQVLDGKAKQKEIQQQIKALDQKITERKKQHESMRQKRTEKAISDTAYLSAYQEKKSRLTARYQQEIQGKIAPETHARNVTLAKEILLSVSKYAQHRSHWLIRDLLNALKKAMTLGVDLSDDAVCNGVFENVVSRAKLTEETATELHGVRVLNLAKVRFPEDWNHIRGTKIATVFQDPMTSLNPIITIGKQITSVILKHQQCSETEARIRALTLMKKVGIPNAENRFDDYPFQYSGGMRQRIVIAIALSCQPKILICDEPTTALDVTIQAQILQLLKDLQREFNYTIVFITHDLGVVANISDRVAVLYAGQIVELGKVEEVFYDPRHPYTWALLSSLPQLAQRDTQLYSISGTPPSLYNEIVGDPFAPRNPYCLKLDTLKEPPMFQVSETHFAKTWLLDPRAPKVEKPEAIQDIHGKLLKAFNI